MAIATTLTPFQSEILLEASLIRGMPTPKLAIEDGNQIAVWTTDYDDPKVDDQDDSSDHMDVLMDLLDSLIIPYDCDGRGGKKYGYISVHCMYLPPSAYDVNCLDGMPKVVHNMLLDFFNNKALEDLPIVADLLEEHGCKDLELLQLCRNKDKGAFFRAILPETNMNDTYYWAGYPNND